MQASKVAIDDLIVSLNLNWPRALERYKRSMNHSLAA
jgi:hypothetical protein